MKGNQKRKLLKSLYKHGAWKHKKDDKNMIKFIKSFEFLCDTHFEQTIDNV